MDRHDVPEVTQEQVAEAHLSDVRIAGDYGVQFFSYWLDADAASVFCLARAPDAEAMITVHRESHGLMPAEIIEVSENDVIQFLGFVHEPADASEVTNPFRMIAFSDLVGSTELLHDLGQSEFMVRLTEHDLILRTALVRFHGREVKHTGDGIMASFEDVGNALNWALNVRHTFGRRTDMQIRLGLAAGEPVDHNQDIFGAAVTQASRICDVADPGHILVSDVVYDLGVHGGFDFGEGTGRTLKGFKEPALVYELLGSPQR